MVEKYLEDIIHDDFYLDPLFSQGLYDHMKEAKEPILDNAWNHIKEKICSTPEFKVYLKNIGYDHIERDIEALKPVVFLCLYYLGEDYLYRDWLKTPGDNKQKKKATYYGETYLKRFREYDRDEVRYLPIPRRIENLEKKEGLDIHADEEVYTARDDSERHSKKMPSYLKGILMTSPNYSNPAFNIIGSNKESRLEHLSGVNDPDNNENKQRLLFSPELILYFQKIYNDVNFEACYYTPEEINLINNPASSEKEKKDIADKRQKRIEDHITETAKKWRNIENYLTSLTPILFQITDCIAGHKNAKYGYVSAERIDDIDLAIKDWCDYACTEHSLCEYLGGNKSKYPAQKSIDKLLINWALEDLIKRKKLNMALQVGFQYIVDNGILSNRKNKRIHQKIFSACSFLLYYPLPSLLESHKADVNKYLDRIIGKEGSNSDDYALTRLLLFADVLFPCITYSMAVLLFCKVENNAHDLDLETVKISLNGLKTVIVSSKDKYRDYDPSSIIRIKFLRTSKGWIFKDPFIYDDDAPPVQEEDLYNVAMEYATIGDIKPNEDFLVDGCRLDRKLTKLKFEEIYKELMDPVVGQYYRDQLFSRKQLLSTYHVVFKSTPSYTPKADALISDLSSFSTIEAFLHTASNSIYSYVKTS